MKLVVYGIVAAIIALTVVECAQPDIISEPPANVYKEVIDGHVYIIADCPHHGRFGLVHYVDCPCKQKDSV